MGKQLFIAEKKYFPAGHSCRDGNMEKHWISECVHLRTVRTKLMPHWSAILNMAVNLVLVIRRIAKSAEVNVFVLVFRCTCCTYGCLWVCVSVWSSTCKCDSFTHLQSSISFQPSLLLGRAFPVCSVAPCAAVTVFPLCVRTSRESLKAPSSWCGRLRLLDGGGGEIGEGSGVGAVGGILSPTCFILTSFPRAPHTSWNLINYALSMTQRSKWHSEECCVVVCALWKSS